MSLLKRVEIGLICLVLSFGTGTATAEVVAVVSSSSPITALSQNQVVDIFLGRLTRLPGGEHVVPIDHAEGSLARDEFYEKFAGRSPAQIKAHWSKIIFTGRGQPPRTVSNAAEVKKRLGENPNAIGYIDETMVDGSVKVVRVR